ncbi:MAG: TIGR04282 family arsenosugar biosynthesis glycosyltransferase [Mucilaginibacter sp.]
MMAEDVANLYHKTAMSNDTLLIFARNPVYGKVKTRLAATIGNDKALQIYRQLLEHTAAVTQPINADRVVYYSDFIADNDAWDNNYSKAMQRGIDLGERMSNASKDKLETGAKKAIIIGTDCYELDTEIIANAFTQLSNYDIVIGPALDGGYYLLGMNSHYPKLFNDITWSTDTVLKETIARCAELGLRHFLLPVLSDIDDENDLLNYPILNGS